jgi:hypothetical protein
VAAAPVAPVTAATQSTQAAAGAPSGGGAAGQTSAPTVGALSLRSTISAGTLITLSATVPENGDVTRISVFEVANASAARKSARKVTRGKLIARVYRKTPKAKRYTIRLTEKPLRKLKPGRYLVEVRTGKSRTSLGPAKTRVVRIKKAKRPITTSKAKPTEGH